MGIFNTAIQTLSEVAIQESGTKIPQETNTNLVEEFLTELSHIKSVGKDDMIIDVRMVPVRESRDLGKYLIEMEDLSRYMMTNGISSIKEAIGNILESNGLVGQFANTAIVIDEASILNELEDLGVNVAGNYPQPQPGVGKTIYGDQGSMQYIRRIANTKELLDTLYNNYGIPVVKKNYKQLGFLEDALAKKQDGEQVLHETDPEKKGKKDEEEKCDCGKPDCPICNPDPDKKKYCDDDDDECEDDDEECKSECKSSDKKCKSKSKKDKYEDDEDDDDDESMDETTLSQFKASLGSGSFNSGTSSTTPSSSPSPTPTGNLSNLSSYKGPSYNNISSNDSLMVQRAKFAKQNQLTNSGVATNESAYLDRIQYLKDVANGRYDDII